MDNEEYPSDSEQSDEDFCPDEAGSDVSEENSDECEDEVEEHKPSLTKRNLKKKINNKNKLNESSPPTVRSTRNTGILDESKINEKNELVSDEEDNKERSDALWAEFLSDASRVSSSTSATKNSTIEKEKLSSSSSSSSTKVIKPTVSQTPQPFVEDKIKVTEILEFAGEEIKVTKEVPVNSTKSDHTSQTSKGNTSKELPKFGRGPFKRASSGGLNSILGQIGKKTKISVLDKSKLDWEGFKESEGLKEELQTFNKGKDGYLERQDFLQRTDVRQFEIERGLRQSKRNN